MICSLYFRRARDIFRAPLSGRPLSTPPGAATIGDLSSYPLVRRKCMPVPRVSGDDSPPPPRDDGSLPCALF